MKYRITQHHSSKCPKPLILKQGAIVKVGGLYNGENNEWVNWRYCTSIESNLSGWVPDQIIAITDEHGMILEDYDATELDCYKESIIEGIQELNGWVWCRDLTNNRRGWVPKNKLEKIDTKRVELI
ncbi:hypothetical protein JOC86_000368 [Bacillus pakistanensis]|uniref:SH3 domain-containing protein n=1 Tax=Rossellomorea pakistanensis TaxID=992288 RepID=A0ABS2N7K4_9BACI|nr:ligand-binding protein SH3 [Bacillus pakistanensis]MBM7583831.1 hypothetical protein [Bacillus pakistanensis]